MQILDGKLVAAQVKSEVQKETQQLIKNQQIKPGLSVVLVGDDPASQVYVKNKIATCLEMGFESFEERLPSSTDFATLKKTLEKLNANPQVHGILVQLPLPKGLDESAVLALVDPAKDVDCLSDHNLGLLFKNKQKISPCTPAGVMEILKYYKYKVEGMNAVVVGRSHIVGLPMSQLLLQANATVTIAHSKTKDLRAHLQKADLVVVAAGKPQFLTNDDFNKNAIVIDVGIHRMENKKLCGDVKAEGLNVAAYTPVPGGVGPMTIAMLMKNTLDLCKLGRK